MNKFYLLAALPLAACGYSVEKQKVEAPKGVVTFAQAAEVLGPRCAACHGNYSSAEGALAERLEIVRRIQLPAGANGAMPPSGPLSASELAIVLAWSEGVGAAPQPQQPPEAPTNPAPEPQPPREDPAPTVSFALLEERVLGPRCQSCHDGRFSQYEEALVWNAEILRRMELPLGFPGRMPIREVLAAEELQLVRDWVAAGSPR